jgi:EAL domain-containing protein (putative c-di-GMP-specific phosphodiesterase class I)
VFGECHACCQEIAGKIRNEGCDEVQGFLFSAAKPPGEIAALFSKFEGRASQAA